MLKKFYSSIDTILESDQELSAKLHEMRNLLMSIIQENEFRLECIEDILDTMDQWQDQEKPWGAPPIFYHEKLKYSIRIIFWPAFYENNPHEHKTWGITGVFHNKLNINTYEMLTNPTRLKKERTITAQEGEVGYLLPGCIHNVNNISHELSASFHIFNNVADINHPEDNAIWYPSPRRHNLSQGLLERALLVCLLVVSEIKHPKSQLILDRIYAKSSLFLKLYSINAMFDFDRVYAKNRYLELRNIFD